MFLAHLDTPSYRKQPKNLMLSMLNKALFRAQFLTKTPPSVPAWREGIVLRRCQIHISIPERAPCRYHGGALCTVLGNFVVQPNLAASMTAPFVQETRKMRGRPLPVVALLLISAAACSSSPTYPATGQQAKPGFSEAGSPPPTADLAPQTTAADTTGGGSRGSGGFGSGH